MSRKDYYHVKNSPKPNSIVPAASAVVINCEGKILLQKRKDNNFWALPGGVMEPGESITQTIIREVKEETGLKVRIDILIGIYTDPKHIIEYSNGEIRQQFSICFLCVPESDKITVSDESYEVKYFTKNELKKINIHPAQSIRINDCLSRKEKVFIR